METAAVYHVDSVPVASLTDRYQIGRTAIYDRLKALGIEPEKRGRASHISSAQLDQMDQLDLRLKAGEPMPIMTTEHSPDTYTEQPPNTSIATLSPSTDAAILTLAAMLKRPSDPLSNHAALQRCADSKWLLSSAQLREFVGIQPKGNEFKRMGFTFTRHDREWEVTARN